MVNFTVDELRKMMDDPTNIRNLSVIAHVDHGKSTLTDSLIGAAGIIAAAKAGDTRFMDTRDDEQDRTITIKGTAVSLHFNMTLASLALFQAKTDEEEKKSHAIEGEQDFLINLIDSPGHVDFSSEVTAALRVTDGALVVVDCIEGVCVQTETVLRQAIQERIKPVLFVNKLDRVFLELHKEAEDSYHTFFNAIQSVNVVIATYQDVDAGMGDVQVYPNQGTVGFGSGLHGWGFTIQSFASMYAKISGSSMTKWVKRLWGEQFYNRKTKKWSNKQYDAKGKKGARGFAMYIMTPIMKLFEAVMNDKEEVYMKMLKKLQITIPKDAVDLRTKPLLKRIMQTWLPAAETLLRMIAVHLPSPLTAQKYRMEILYNGPKDDECAKAIAACDANGPLMMYVSKMVPTQEKGRFYAFGRVFAGTIATGQAVRIQGPEYVPGSRKDLSVGKKVQRCVLMMGRYVEQLQNCPCGNIVGLVGIDGYILKTGTITTHKEAYNFKTMKYSVAAVVRVSVEPKNAKDLPKLVEGLKKLAKSDPLVQIITTKTGEKIIAGAGELHLEICLKDLREDFMKGAPIKIGKPVVPLCETVTEESSMTCVSKSPNKHNRVYLTAEPIEQELQDALEDQEIKMEMEEKKRIRQLVDEHQWDKQEARKLWAVGVKGDGVANMIVDTTKGVQYLNEVKDHICTAFHQVCEEGVWCREPLRGCRFNIEDVTLHADSIHRGAGQMMPCAKRVIYATQLKSGPAMMEPLFLCDIQVPDTLSKKAIGVVKNRRGEVDEIKQEGLGNITSIRCFLPIMESFGFTENLRAETGGKAFPQLVFDSWSMVRGSPADEGSSANKMVMATRERKGLKLALPVFGDYYDKI